MDDFILKGAMLLYVWSPLPDSVRAGLIRQEDEYGGFRVKLQAKLTAARLDLQVDVGVGDAVAHLPTIDYPTLLEFPAPRLRAYSREAAIAEKFHAMVDHGFENSRMKDFFGVWALSREFAFDGPDLAAAIGATFDRRGTPIPASTPVAFTPAFAADPTKAKQWKAFLVRARVRMEPPPFEVVVGRVAEFLQPVAEAARLGTVVRSTWTAGGPWANPGP